jgi:hypothetical protein
MWAGMPRCCGSGNGHGRKEAKTPFQATVASARSRKYGIVCGKKASGCGWCARVQKAARFFAPEAR